MNARSFFNSVFITLAGLGLTVTQPLSASTVVAEYAIVYAPPSNIRAKPNGKFICRVSKKVILSVYYFTTDVNTPGSPINGWYSTNACGINRIGWIHKSQIKLTGKYHSAP